MKILFALILLVTPGQVPAPLVLDQLATFCWALDPGARLNVFGIVGTTDSLGSASLVVRCIRAAETPPKEPEAPQVKPQRWAT